MMKRNNTSHTKKIGNIIIGIFILIGVLYFAYQMLQAKEATEEEYLQIVSSFTPMTVDEASEKLNNQDDFFIYLGRKTCPDCRVFILQFHEAITETNTDPTTIFYMDSENYKTDHVLQLFRQIHGIDTVPHLLIQKDGEISTHDAIPLSTKDFVELLKNFTK